LQAIGTDIIIAGKRRGHFNKMSDYYPRVTVDLKKFRHNIDQIKSRCAAQGVNLTGVIKGCSGIPACAKAFEDAGCQYIGTSRLEQIRGAMDFGVKGPFMLLRVPMISEADEAVRLAEISLNSELSVLRALNEAAARQGKTHKVLLMADLGDLREGFWDRGELLAAAQTVERELDHLYLAGVGTNLGCYGSIFPGVEKLTELVTCAETVEAAIGRRLDIVSGGASSSLPRIFNHDMPERINQLRVGEAIINARDLQDLFGYDTSFLHRDAFVLQAEVIEVKDKPSYPVGEIMFDAFGGKPEYTDRGIRRRALLALGKVDYAFPDMLMPTDEGVTVLGASSDHTIVDIEDAKREIKVGDIMSFMLCYAANVFLTSSPNVKIVIEE
jgi:predicted amino acid racemase